MMMRQLAIMAAVLVLGAGAGAALAKAPAPVRAGAPAAERAQAREIFEHIVGIESSVGKGNVPAVANYLAGLFLAGGFPAADVHVLPLGETASLVVRYRGNGRGGRPIDLIAHMDVVTANRGDWQRDPFRLIEENGYFFGRGTSDVKQEVALITTTFLALKARGYVPTRDLIVAFSGDEETEMTTARDLVTTHRDLVDAEFALNADGGGGVLAEATGKPELFYLQGAEKSSVSYTLTTRNPGGHSSMPRPDNAIYELAGRSDDAVRGQPEGRGGGGGDLQKSGFRRTAAHHLCRDPAVGRPCQQRPSPIRGCDRQLSDLSRHVRRGRALGLAASGGIGRRGPAGGRGDRLGCIALASRRRRRRDACSRGR
jgi:hypothetical protein